MTVIDHRTGKKIELEIKDGCVQAIDFRALKENPDDFGCMYAA